MKDRIQYRPSNATTPVRKITKPVQPGPSAEVHLVMVRHLPGFTTRGRC